MQLEHRILQGVGNARGSQRRTDRANDHSLRIAAGHDKAGDRDVVAAAHQDARRNIQELIERLELLRLQRAERGSADNSGYCRDTNSEMMEKPRNQEPTQRETVLKSLHGATSVIPRHLSRCQNKTSRSSS